MQLTNKEKKKQEFNYLPLSNQVFRENKHKEV